MNTKKNRRGQSGITKHPGGLLNSNDEHIEVNYYHTGDINVHIPVYLSPSASVVGNITAPVVVLAGKMFGVIAADTVAVETGGQLWGDIYTSEYHLQPGAKCYGWIISLDRGTVELLRSGDLSLDDVTAAGVRPIPADFAKEHAISKNQLPMNPEQYLFVYRHLQTELAAARMARIEIELAFEDRLAEVKNQSEFREQLVKEMRRSSWLNQANDGASGESEPLVAEQIPTDTVTLREYQQLENEVQQYKDKAETFRKKFETTRKAEAALESELVQMKHTEDIQTEEISRLRGYLTERISPEGEATDYDGMLRAENLRKVEAELAKAQLRIEEMQADLAYYRHLSRGVDK